MPASNLTNISRLSINLKTSKPTSIRPNPKYSPNPKLPAHPFTPQVLGPSLIPGREVPLRLPSTTPNTI